MNALFQSLFHPDELFSLVKYKMGAASKLPKINSSTEMEECYHFLNMTSRSFALVIQKLDPGLREAICIFYLVLRGLDTIEDDMTIPLEKKVKLLQEFHLYCKKPGWTFTESGPNEKDAPLLVKFDVVIHELLKLNVFYQDPIIDIAKRMGYGMSEFLTKGVSNEEEWNLYCHYVAGLVGIGLSAIFSASNLENPNMAKREDLSNSMGLFLQKTNIIRDYLEDITDGRIFWPKSVWSLYANQLSDFKDAKNKQAALNCLNHLINNALTHIPDVFGYMDMLRNRSVFNFCVIPQIMAIATLSACYNNHNVYTSVVKIRKGETVKLILKASDMTQVREIFSDYLDSIESRAPKTPLGEQTIQIIADVRAKSGLSTKKKTQVISFVPNLIIFSTIVASTAFMALKIAGK